VGKAEGHIPPSHETVEHASEIRMRVRAGSLAELLAEAGRALAELQLRESVAPAQGDWRALDVSAGDSAALLAEWLNELIFLAETERWVATQFEIQRIGAASVTARARGVAVDRAPGLVKAATLHGLRVEEVPGGTTGEVILDV
jgi:SHS2 domain-containing protein